ncbi:MAG: hypothetical protein ACEQSX_17590, partial [Baekduiaceae bacterium]
AKACTRAVEGILIFAFFFIERITFAHLVRTSVPDVVNAKLTVGLARLEFIINNNIGVHPKAILDYPNIGDDLEELAAVIREALRPHLVIAGGEGEVPLLRDRPAVDGRPTAYVCERFACQAPVTEPDALRAALA